MIEDEDSYRKHGTSGAEARGRSKSMVMDWFSFVCIGEVYNEFRLVRSCGGRPWAECRCTKTGFVSSSLIRRFIKAPTKMFPRKIDGYIDRSVAYLTSTELLGT